MGLSPKTHGVFCARKAETQVRRREANDGQLADAPVLQLRLSQEVEGDEARETDGVEPSVPCWLL